MAGGEDEGLVIDPVRQVIATVYQEGDGTKRVKERPGEVAPCGGAAHAGEHDRRWRYRGKGLGPCDGKGLSNMSPGNPAARTTMPFGSSRLEKARSSSGCAKSLVGERVVLVGSRRRSASVAVLVLAVAASTTTAVISWPVEESDVLSHDLDNLAILSIARLIFALLKEPAVDGYEPALRRVVRDEIGGLAPRLDAREEEGVGLALALELLIDGDRKIDDGVAALNDALLEDRASAGRWRMTRLTIALSYQ